jgi:hypothetical protein
MTERYKVSTRNEEIEHTCCYDCCIVDLHEPYKYRPGTFTCVAEFKEYALAEQTCKLLNEAQP